MYCISHVTQTFREAYAQKRVGPHCFLTVLMLSLFHTGPLLWLDIISCDGSRDLGYRDLGSSANPLPAGAGTLDGLRPRVDQTGVLLGCDFLHAVQAHGPASQGQSAGALARVPDRGGDQGLGPY
jgi:hypothetical protein